MQFEGTTYRPPLEADSMLLQVTVGCAHNRCRFCNMYRDVKFRMVEIEQIKKDILEARQIYPKAERVFLVNGDAFVLPTKRLKEIAQLIIESFPECRTISMYSSIRNIRGKSDTELRELKNLKIDDLYVGVESGSATVIKNINKGHTVDEAARQLQRLNNIGINHISNLMLGVAGHGKGLENARHTAAFLNQVHPKLIWVGTLAPFKGTELYQEIEAGEFVQATELEILLEEKELIRSLNLENTTFYGVHPTNTVRVSGRMPEKREQMLDTIDKSILQYGEEVLTKTFHRSSL